MQMHGGESSSTSSSSFFAQAFSRGASLAAMVKTNSRRVSANMWYTMSMQIRPPSIAGVTTLDPLLLRGMPAWEALRGGGAIFSGSVGTAKTFNMSAPVQELDVFVSHNWSVGRRQKFISLAVYFNFTSALVVSAIVVIVLAAMVLADLIPVFDFVNYYGPGNLKMSVVCLPAGYVSWLAVMFFGHEVKAILRLPTKKIFLDKTCIHQTDPVSQREGILGLAAFLKVSRSMLILWTPVYPCKLWTVYELASMLLLNPDRRIVVLPTFLPLILLSGLSLSFLFQATSMLSRLVPVLAGIGIGTDGIPYLLEVGVVLAGLLWAVGLRKSAKVFHESFKVAATFNVRSALCANEADRPIVLRNIVAFLRDRHEDHELSEDAALDLFDSLVQTEMPQTLRDSTGVHLLPYWLNVVVCLPFLWYGADMVCGLIVMRRPWYHVAADAIYWISITFAMFPLRFSCPFWLLRCNIQAKGFHEVAHIALSWCAVVALWGSTDLATNKLYELVSLDGDPAAFAGYVAWFVAWGVGCFAFFANAHAAPQQRLSIIAHNSMSVGTLPSFASSLNAVEEESQAI